MVLIHFVVVKRYENIYLYGDTNEHIVPGIVSLAESNL